MQEVRNMISNEELVKLCQDVIRIPSPSGHEEKVSKFLKGKMEELGFDEVNIDRYGSVYGVIHGKRPGKTILMDGHIDNVDVIDEDQWSHAPWGAEITDGKIYGRGTSDMKGSVTAMICAAARLAESTGKDFAGNICVSGTVHEECFEGVSSREISKILKPDYVIIGEATTSTVKIGQRGRAEVVVNEVRINAGMPTVSITDPNEFMKALQNEWRVEFAFEDHRFWDIRRWQIGEDTQKELYGVNIERATDGTWNFQRTLYKSRTWSQRMYLYPIPQSELFKNKNLNPQNMGW